MHQGAHVQVDLPELPRERELPELAHGAEAGVDHEEVEVARAQPLFDLSSARVSGQVRLDDLSAHASDCRERRGQLLEAVLAPRDQHEVPATTSKLAGKLLADA